LGEVLVISVLGTGREKESKHGSVGIEDGGETSDFSEFATSFFCFSFADVEWIFLNKTVDTRSIDAK